MFNSYRLWRNIWSATAPRKRSHRSRVGDGFCSEALEARCLLSAVMSSDTDAPVAADCETIADEPEPRHAKAASRATPRKKAFPNVAGTWTYTVFPGGEPIEGELELTQKGKKVKGTLTREFQPPGVLKGKLKSQPADSTRGVDRDVADIVWFIAGTLEDFSLASVNLKFAFGVIFVPDSGGDVAGLSGTIKTPEGDVEADIFGNSP